MKNKASICCSGYGSVGIAVVSYTRGPRFVSSHRQNLYGKIYWTFFNCFEKTKNKGKRGRKWPFLKKFQFTMIYVQWPWPNKMKYQNTAENSSSFETQISQMSITYFLKKKLTLLRPLLSSDNSQFSLR